MSYWELFPTIDHIVPVARGGSDTDSNRVTTSMMRNAAKANWTMEELGWFLQPAGDLRQWDGLMKHFLALIDMDPTPLAEPYIKKWHDLAVEAMK
ncbi:MAG: HNH endonuclease domain-containing protein [Candidatus Krumholzibacteriaceae bacterium]